MRQIQSAARVSRQLRKAETAIDQAIIEANTLIGALISARRDEKFAAEVGHDALASVTRSVETLVQARGHMVAGHTGLAQVAEALGAEWRMDGPLDEKIKEMPLYSADDITAA